MISFFGTASDIKQQHIPLHVVGLVGGSSDLSWTVENALVIDPVEFEAFRRRTLLGVWNLILNDKCIESASSMHSLMGAMRNAKLAHVRRFFIEATQQQTYEGLVAFMAEARGFSVNHRLWMQVLSNDVWTSPKEYIDFVTQHINATTGGSSTIGLAMAAARDAAKSAAAATAAPAAPRSHVAGFVDDREDAAPVAPRARVADFQHPSECEEEDRDDVDEDDDEDDDDDEDRPRRAPAARAKREVWFFESSTKPGPTLEKLARVLTADPYAFMNELKYKLPRGITRTSGANQALRVEVTETNAMFHVLHTLAQRSRNE